MWHLYTQQNNSVFKTYIDKQQKAFPVHHFPYIAGFIPAIAHGKSSTYGAYKAVCSFPIKKQWLINPIKETIHHFGGTGRSFLFPKWEISKITTNWETSPIWHLLCFVLFSGWFSSFFENLFNEAWMDTHKILLHQMWCRCTTVTIYRQTRFEAIFSKSKFPNDVFINLDGKTQPNVSSPSTYPKSLSITEPMKLPSKSQR